MRLDLPGSRRSRQNRLEGGAVEVVVAGGNDVSPVLCGEQAEGGTDTGVDVEQLVGRVACVEAKPDVDDPHVTDRLEEIHRRSQELLVVLELPECREAPVD